MTEETLKERIDKAIEGANFDILEMPGFRSDPQLALRVGVALGYKLASDNILLILEKKGE